MEIVEEMLAVARHDVNASNAPLSPLTLARIARLHGALSPNGKRALDEALEPSVHALMRSAFYRGESPQKGNDHEERSEEPDPGDRPRAA